jgi:hypothetical protein
METIGESGSSIRKADDADGVGFPDEEDNAANGVTGRRATPGAHGLYR